MPERHNAAMTEPKPKKPAARTTRKKPVAKPASKAAPQAKAEPTKENDKVFNGAYASLFLKLTEEFGLSPKEARFCLEMAVDENASAAYVRAGYAAKTANINAARLMTKDSIQAAIAHVRSVVAERVGYTAQEALKFVADVLRAETDELVKYKISCCRHCYGDKHLYQRTAGEMAQARAKHEAMVEAKTERNPNYIAPEFDEQGGDGFDLRKPPNTECPVCAGDGAGRVVISDTSKLSPQARALYAGVKEGKDGIEVKMHDKVAMVEKMFRYHGLYEIDNKQQAGQVVDQATLIALSEAMDKSREDRRAMLAKRAQDGFTGD